MTPTRTCCGATGPTRWTGWWAPVSLSRRARPWTHGTGAALTQRSWRQREGTGRGGIWPCTGWTSMTPGRGNWSASTGTPPTSRMTSCASLTGWTPTGARPPACPVPRSQGDPWRCRPRRHPVHHGRLLHTQVVAGQRRRQVAQAAVSQCPALLPQESRHRGAGWGGYLRGGVPLGAPPRRLAPRPILRLRHEQPAAHARLDQSFVPQQLERPLSGVLADPVLLPDRELARQPAPRRHLPAGDLLAQDVSELPVQGLSALEVQGHGRWH